jgi:hypothetical protein
MVEKLNAIVKSRSTVVSGAKVFDVTVKVSFQIPSKLASPASTSSEPPVPEATPEILPNCTEPEADALPFAFEMLISGLVRTGPEEARLKLSGTLETVPVALTLLLAVSPLESPNAGATSQKVMTPRHKGNAVNLEVIAALKVDCNWKRPSVYTRLHGSQIKS